MRISFRTLVLISVRIVESETAFANVGCSCRACGDLVCNSCSKQRIHLPAQGKVNTRVCDRCVISPERSQGQGKSGGGSSGEGTTVFKAGTPLVPEEYVDKLEAVLAKVLAVDKVSAGQDGWEKLGSKKRVTWMYRNASDGTSAQMAKGKVDIPARLWFEMVQDEAVAKKIEPMIDQFNKLQRMDQHNQVYQMVMKPVWPTSSRDICVYEHWRTEEDGTIILAQFSTTHEKAPEVSTRVRAWQDGGGIIIRPDKENLQACTVTYFVDVDIKLGDSVPKWAMRKVNELNASMLGNGILKMEKEAKKRLTEEHVRKPLLTNHNGTYTVESGSEDGAAKPEQKVEAPRFVVTWEHVVIVLLLILLVLSTYHNTYN